MSNLYTEEQVNRIANQVRINGFWNSQDFIPIQLPTDEEVEMAAPYVPRDAHDYYIGYRDGLIEGAKWMRDKIKGVVNEKEVL